MSDSRLCAVISHPTTHDPRMRAQLRCDEFGDTTPTGSQPIVPSTCTHRAYSLASYTPTGVNPTGDDAIRHLQIRLMEAHAADLDNPEAGGLILLSSPPSACLIAGRGASGRALYPTLTWKANEAPDFWHTGIGWPMSAGTRSSGSSREREEELRVLGNWQMTKMWPVDVRHWGGMTRERIDTEYRSIVQEIEGRSNGELTALNA